MPLAALILIDDGRGEDGAAERALLTVAGQTLIECQARLAQSCGAGHIVVLSSRPPTALSAAIERLRADGIAVDISHTVRDAADRVHPEERLMVIADNAVAPRTVLQDAIDTGESVILAVPDDEHAATLERIDRAERWSGLAVIDGRLLRATARMLGDWTLGPTLLRMALQSGVPTRLVEGSVRVEDTDSARAASTALSAPGATGCGGVANFVFKPILEAVLPRLLTRPMPFQLAAPLPVALLVLSALLALSRWPSLALLVLVLASLGKMLVEHIAGAGGRPTQFPALAGKLMLPTLALALGAGAWFSAPPDPVWMGLILAAWAVTALFLQPPGAVRATWMADTDSAALIMLIALIAGQPLAGLVAIVAHAVVTQFVLVRRAM